MSRLPPFLPYQLMGTPNASLYQPSAGARKSCDNFSSFLSFLNHQFTAEQIKLAGVPSPSHLLSVYVCALSVKEKQKKTGGPGAGG